MYEITGSVNSLMMLVTLLGLWTQLRIIWRRKQDVTIVHCTDLLSTHQFLAAFLAYYTFFIHGYAITPFNHFIVWPRLVAGLLVTMVLFEIYQDRKTRNAKMTLVFCLCSLIAGIIGLLLNRQIGGINQQTTTMIIVAVTVFLAQGYYHQIRLIITHGETGAVALRLNQFTGLKDVSTIAFALTMDFNDSWPLILLATVSGITKLVIMYLFHWVKISEAAKTRSKARAKTT